MKRISPHVSALIDSEKSSAADALSADRAAFHAECAQARIPCGVLERRALENYWTDRAVKTAKGPSFSALGPYERLKEGATPWAKADNWRIAREMTIEDLAGTDLRHFLESL